MKLEHFLKFVCFALTESLENIETEGFDSSDQEVVLMREITNAISVSSTLTEQELENSFFELGLEYYLVAFADSDEFGELHTMALLYTKNIAE